MDYVVTGRVVCRYQSWVTHHIRRLMGITVDSVASASQEVIRNKQDPYVTPAVGNVNSIWYTFHSKHLYKNGRRYVCVNGMATVYQH